MSRLVILQSNRNQDPKFSDSNIFKFAKLIPTGILGPETGRKRAGKLLYTLYNINLTLPDSIRSTFHHYVASADLHQIFKSQIYSVHFQIVEVDFQRRQAITFNLQRAGRSTTWCGNKENQNNFGTRNNLRLLLNITRTASQKARTFLQTFGKIL